MSPLEQIQKMPEDALPRVTFNTLIDHMEKDTGHVASRETREHVATNLYVLDRMKHAINSGDVVTLLAEVTMLAALHLTALHNVESARPADPKPLTDDETLDAYDGLRALTSLPDFGIDLTGRGN